MGGHMTELWRLDASAQANLLQHGEVTSQELIEGSLARIEALNPILNAVTDVRPDLARSQAAQTQGTPFGGVPTLLKDLLPQPGFRCAMGSRLFADFIPPVGTPLTERMAASGLICLGKTTTSEFGLLGSTETALEGVTRNPWHPQRSAGGSSGGAAAAVACGLVPIAHASDGGGSIRLPAALCGLFGFKRPCP